MTLHSGKLDFKCLKCPKQFRTKDVLRQHVLRNHPEPEPEVENPPKSKPEVAIDKPFVCDICGKGFKKKATCEIHVMRHKGEKPHQCNFCDWKFVTSYELNFHLINKHNTKPKAKSKPGPKPKQPEGTKNVEPITAGSEAEVEGRDEIEDHLRLLGEDEFEDDIEKPGEFNCGVCNKQFKFLSG